MQGEGVSGYRIRAAPESRRVVVTLGGDLKSATEAKFPRMRVPTEGRFRVPAIRPLNATWTGGITTVILDPFHVVAECTEKAGRRVFGKGEPSGGAERRDSSAVT